MPESAEGLKMGLQSGDWILVRKKQSQSQLGYSRLDQNQKIGSLFDLMKN